MSRGSNPIRRWKKASAISLRGIATITNSATDLLDNYNIKQYVSDNFETLSAGYSINADADTSNVDDYLGVYVIASASSIDFEVIVLNAGIVPIGVKEIIEKQFDGYAYLKP